jgi:hypothetical protein
MIPTNQSNQICKGIRKTPNTLMMIVLMTTIFLISAANLFAQLQVDRKYEIALKSLTFQPVAGISTDTIEAIQSDLNRIMTDTLLTKVGKIHFLVQLERMPTRREKEDIKRYGIQFLNYIPNYTWIIAVSGNVEQALTGLESLRLRWIGRLTPELKISEAIRENRFEPYSIMPDDKAKVLVQFHKTVPIDIARQIVQRHDGEVNNEVRTINSLIITISKRNISSLSEEDGVVWVELAPAPLEGTNDGARNATNVDIVNNAPYNLDGDGVIVLVFDGGLVDDAHDDLSGRVTQGEDQCIFQGRVYGTADHATHVAGTLGGDGSSSVAAGGTANQWRGMAPAVDIISYGIDWDGTDIFLYNNLTDMEDNYEEAVNTYNIDLATASVGTNVSSNGYSCSMEGDYNATSQLIDGMVRGSLGRPIIMTWAAGNERICPGYARCGRSYNTINPPANAKNPIHVGAIHSDDNSMTDFSGWGPSDDGRLKPLVVAPGCVLPGLCSPGFNDGITSTVPNLYIDHSGRNCAPGVPGAGPNTNGDDHCYPYSVMCGTSMATPVVAGIASLMLQQYRITYDTDERLLPSTMKAILMHTALDLGNPGPDFQFGYGLVDAQAAVDLIRSGEPLFFESQINDPGEEEVFLVDVPTGQAEFNVTLAWDDAPGLINSTLELQNDLDLELEAPDGTILLPWILDPSVGHEGDNAITGKDDLNNQEQIHIVNPVAGTWKIRIIGNIVPEPIQNYSVVSDFPLKFYQNVSVVQVIDRTGSMSARDNSSLPTYMESAKIAAQNFIGLMQLEDEIGVVSFDKHGSDPLAQNIFELEELTNERMRNNAISSIDPLTARGATSIGAGLQLAQAGPNYLNVANTDNPHAMVLLTDGFENNPPWVRERPDDYSYKPATPDNILLTIPQETDIYTITLGSSADEALLRDIAVTTGGKSYNSPTILGLLSIYFQIQGDLELGETTIMTVGTKQGGNDTKVVTVDEGASEATFAIGWLQNNGELKLILKDPNGNDVSLQSPLISSSFGSSYYAIRVKNPVAGDWEVHITRNDSGSFNIDYTFAAFVKDVSKLWSYVPTFEEAGNCLMTKVQLYNDANLQPITNANVQAVVTSPRESVYTLHYNYVKPKKKIWDPSPIYSRRLLTTTGTATQVTSNEMPTFAATLNKYNLESLKQTGQSIFKYDTNTYTLYDDGTHGDEAPNDGYYTYCIPKSEIAGSYNISFKISGVTPFGSDFSRSLLATSLVKPANADPAKVMARIDPQEITLAEGSEGIITIVPIDKYSNLLGPGHASRISISASAGELIGDIIDNGDGFYFKKIISTGIKQSGNITVKIDGIEANLKPEFSIGEEFKKFDFSLHSGTTIPTGALADSFNTGYNALVNLSYSFSPKFSMVGYFGYNDFKSKISGIDDNYCLNLSLNLKYRNLLPTASNTAWYYYIQTGPGYYIPKTGDSGLGANFGAGIDYDFKGYLSFECGSDFHTFFDQNINFWHVHAGFIFRF